MSVTIRKPTASMCKKIRTSAVLVAQGARWEDVGNEMGVHPDTCRHWKAAYPEVFEPAYLEALALAEAELVPLAIGKQRKVLEDDSQDPALWLKAAADARTEHGRGLDRLLKQTEVLKVILVNEVAPQVDAAVEAARSFAREGEEDACECAVRAAFAA